MLSIGEFSKISHLTMKTLRYYDEIGLLKPDFIDVKNGYRYYNISQLETALLITRLKTYLFSLEEIKDILANWENTELLNSKMRAKQEKLTQQITFHSSLLKKLKFDIQQLDEEESIMDYLNHVEINLVNHLTYHIVSQRKRINIADFLTHFNELFSKISFENLSPTAKPLAIFHSSEYTFENYDVEIAIPLAEVTNKTKVFYPGLCAMAILNGSYNELPSIHTKLHVWVKENNYKLNGAPFEVYKTNPYSTLEENNIIEVYFPIK
ncbi:TPA: MerR family transcriptional regulator [Bacillus thuringiensis]|uniref:MerR family transcriptional regulator n=1 Tax=Bacillus wiedmannii TaxID=1890302 RepID=UPI000BFA65BE|nr:MerR family transcriptional regulator [Bacillus cereus]PGS04918.1 MerR family transcriptional regulator [Bacillus cereus]HDR8172088.1 MerR family transcriptional regulator [Bacillus thuringiensis]